MASSPQYTLGRSVAIFSNKTVAIFHRCTHSKQNANTSLRLSHNAGSLFHCSKLCNQRQNDINRYQVTLFYLVLVSQRYTQHDLRQVWQLKGIQPPDISVGFIPPTLVSCMSSHWHDHNPRRSCPIWVI